MNARAAHTYLFGDFRLDSARRVLRRGDEPVPLTPKAFDTLLVLVRKSGSVVEKDELLNEVWPDSFVEEANLAQNIFTLRKALGRRSDGGRYIETVPKYGYRFAAPVRVLTDAGPEPVEVSHDASRVVVRKPGVPTTADQECLNPVCGDASGDEEGGIKSVGAKEVSAEASAAATTPPLGSSKRKLGRFVLIASACLVAVAALFALRYWKGRGAGAEFGAPFRRMRLSVLTNSGKAVVAAVSPDGKYVVYAAEDGGQQSLWLRQLNAARDIQIVPPYDAKYQGITFAPDGGSIYYAVYERGGYVGLLYQVPMLGGVPKKVVEDVDSSVTFSPDGKRFAFLRGERGGQGTALVVVNADGSGEQRLASYPKPGSFSDGGPSWSPDGEIIICPVRVGGLNRNKMSLAEVRVADGEVRPATSRQWDHVGQVAWLSGGEGLLTDAWDQSVSSLSAQIWRVSYPEGDAQMLTNDLNSYHGVSGAADSRTLATVESGRVANFWVSPSGEADAAKQITSGGGDKRGETIGVSWTPDGRIVYGSTSGGGINIWIMDADGNNPKQLTDGGGLNLRPSVSPDGRSVVFASRRAGAPHLWVMNIDGSNARQLTDGSGEHFPSVSPDGLWVAYASISEGKSTVWKVPIGGGAPTQLDDHIATLPSVSPDGATVACYYQETPDSPPRIAIIPSSGGPPLKSFDAPTGALMEAGLRWVPDGRAVAYVSTSGGVSNVWSQPLDGRPPKRLTDFTSGRIFRFAWSQDGKRFLFERGVEIKDVVLITDDDAGKALAR